MKNDRPDLLSQLEEGILRLTSSDAWRDYLDFQSRFHRYSYRNTLLIAAQNREATHVAGFKTWRSLNRFVRRGEKALWILAPMVGKRAEPDDTDEEPVMRGFKYVPVFDIAQTDGDDPPTVCTSLSGDDPDGLFHHLTQVALSLGFTVDEHDFADTTNGDCSPSLHRIRIERRNTSAQRVKTLAHELGHAWLHDGREDRSLAELEAESTAYVVCQALGMSTGDYSFGYVALWSSGGDEAVARIRTSCSRIQKAASVILESLEAVSELAA